MILVWLDFFDLAQFFFDLAQFFSGLARVFFGLGSVQFFQFQVYKIETKLVGFLKILIGLIEFFSQFGFFGYFFFSFLGLIGFSVFFSHPWSLQMFLPCLIY